MHLAFRFTVAFSFAVLFNVPSSAGVSFTPLGRLPGQENENQAWGVSAQGSVVVGASNNSAFRWTESNGILDIGATQWATSQAVSSDGTVAVGCAAN